MIRTQNEYKASLKKLRQNEEALEKQKQYLQSMNLSAEQVQLAMSPLQNFYYQLKKEVLAYERLKNR
jgi:hypothetical protein